MKYLIIIPLFILFSCQKQDYKQVIYSLEHSGYGILKYKFDGQLEFKELKDDTFDTAFIVPNVDYAYQFKIHISHYNETFSYIRAYIIIDGKIKDSLVRSFNSCYTITRTLSYYE